VSCCRAPSSTAKEPLPLDARSSLRESYSRRSRRGPGGPIPSGDRLAQQEGDRGSADETAGDDQLASRTCRPGACALDQRLGERLRRRAGPVERAMRLRNQFPGAQPTSPRAQWRSRRGVASRSIWWKRAIDRLPGRVHEAAWRHCFGEASRRQVTLSCG
jgi:hypothetical protein